MSEPKSNMKVEKAISNQLEVNPAPAPAPTPSPAKPVSVERRAGRALFWNVAFMPFKAALSLMVNVLIVKQFSLNSYTDLAILVALQSTLGLYVDLGIERALPRFVGQIERELGRGALRKLLVTVTLIKLAILAVFIIIVSLFTDSFIAVFLPEVPPSRGRLYIGLMFSLLILGALYDVCTQVLYSFFKQKVTNLLDIIVTVLNPLLTLGLIVWPFHLDVYGVILALLITTIISVGIAAWQAYLASREEAQLAHYERQQKTGQPAKPVSQAQRDNLWKRFAKYSMLMYFFNLSTWFSDASYAILVFSNQLVTVAMIRLSYSFIKQLLKMLLTPFQGVQTPLFSSIHAEGDNNRLQAAYGSLTKLQIFILMPSAVGAIILARNLVQLLFPRTSQDAVLTFANLNQAVWVTILTVFFTFAESLFSIPMVILQVYERYKLVIIARILPVAGGAFLLVAAILNWNAVVAVCIMGSMAVGSRLVALWQVRQTLKLQFPMAFLGRVTLASLAFGIPLGLAANLLPVNWPVTLATAALGVLIFGLVFRKLGGFDQEDKNRLQNLRLPLRKYIIKWL